MPSCWLHLFINEWNYINYIHFIIFFTSELICLSASRSFSETVEGYYQPAFCGSFCHGPPGLRGTEARPRQKGFRFWTSALGATYQHSPCTLSRVRPVNCLSLNQPVNQPYLGGVKLQCIWSWFASHSVTCVWEIYSIDNSCTELVVTCMQLVAFYIYICVYIYSIYTHWICIHKYLHSSLPIKDMQCMYICR